MPLPHDHQAATDILHFIACGDEAAAMYLGVMAELVRLADDLADEDMAAVQRQEKVARLLYLALVVLPSNSFFQRHGSQLSTHFAAIVVDWVVADHWKQNGTEKQQMFGYVRRENMDSLAVAVAVIVGGIDHGIQVSTRLFEVCHADGETFGEWAAERTP